MFLYDPCIASTSEVDHISKNHRVPEYHLKALNHMRLTEVPTCPENSSADINLWKRLIFEHLNLAMTHTIIEMMLVWFEQQEVIENNKLRKTGQ